MLFKWVTLEIAKAMVSHTAVDRYAVGFSLKSNRPQYCQNVEVYSMSFICYCMRASKQRIYSLLQVLVRVVFVATTTGTQHDDNCFDPHRIKTSILRRSPFNISDVPTR